MTQDDSAIIDRLKHESMVRWVRASGRRGWRPCDVRSEVMLDAAHHIETMAREISALKDALEMNDGYREELTDLMVRNQKQLETIERLRAELRTYTDGTNDEVQREAL